MSTIKRKSSSTNNISDNRQKVQDIEEDKFQDEDLDDADVNEEEEALPKRRSSTQILLSHFGFEKETQNNEQQPNQWYRVAALGIGIIFAIVVGVLQAAVTAGPDETYDDDDLTNSLPYDDDSVINFLEKLGDDTLVNMRNVNSAQSKAFQWIKQHPDFLDFNVYRAQQVFALATVFFQMGGPQWPFPFLDYTTNECHWYHPNNFDFFDDSIHEVYNETWGMCDEKGHYQHLYLSTFSMHLHNNDGEGENNNNSNKRMSLPLEVFWLSDLKGLHISGKLPPESKTSLVDLLPPQQMKHFKFFISLETLDLHGLNLVGTIPSQFGLMTNLKSLDLSRNYRLEQTIPTELGQLTQLTHLALYNNGLTGSIPSTVGHLTELQQLLLFDNALSSSIPFELLQLTNLQVLDVGFNQLTGPLPYKLFLFSNLRTLVLSDNDFTGQALENIDSLSNLQELRVSNSFGPGIQLCTNLRFLMVSNHHVDPHVNPDGHDDNGYSVTWSLPTELGMLTELRELYLLNSTAITGSIPSELALLTHLAVFNASGSSQLTGTIPDSMCQFDDDNCYFNRTLSWDDDLTREMYCILDFDCNGNLCGCPNEPNDPCACGA